MSFKKTFFALPIVLCTYLASIGAQEVSIEELPGFREQAVIIHIVSQIVEGDDQVVWEEESSKVTLPGRPLALRLVGENVIVFVQFTPFLRSTGSHVLVAQGQIWINIPNDGVSYLTTMQTIPIEFYEVVYFFPLGTCEETKDARIEIQLVIKPYIEENSSTNNRSRGSRNR